VGAPQITVVVTAARDGAALRQSMLALAAQAGIEPGDAQVIVVADGNPREVRSALDAVTGSLEVELIEHVHAGPASARNAGWRAAAAELVLFLDESHVAGPTLLSRHLAASRARPGSVLVGPVVGPAAAKNAWVDYESASRDRQYRVLGDGTTLRGLPVGGNFSLPRRLLEQIGGFDSLRLRGEHVELGLALTDAGVGLFFDAQAIARDVAAPVLAEWRMAYRMQGRFDVATYRATGYGGVEMLVSSYHDRQLLNRLSIQLALRSRLGQGALERLYARAAIACHAAGLRRAARAACGALANVVYWSSVRDCVRGSDALLGLIRGTRAVRDRPYKLLGHRRA